MHDTMQRDSFFFFLFVCEKQIHANIYTFSPAELSSERGEKEVLADSKQPTAPPSMKSHASYCIARVAEERKWRPKVHQARRDDRFSSRFLSLLLTAAIVPTRPTPLLLCSPLPLSLSPTRFDAFKDFIDLFLFINI